MTVLSDLSIRTAHLNGSLGITPFDESRIQPASYDVALDGKFRIFQQSSFYLINPRAPHAGLTTLIDIGDSPSGFILHPGQFALGQTEEYVEIPDWLCARIEGKSSLGRLGLVIHSTAGWIDPGFNGTVTLELGNVSPLPIMLVKGMLIGQIAFMALTTMAERPYGSPGLNSKYQGDREPAASRYA